MSSSILACLLWPASSCRVPEEATEELARCRFLEARDRLDPTMRLDALARALELDHQLGSLGSEVAALGDIGVEVEQQINDDRPPTASSGPIAPPSATDRA